MVHKSQKKLIYEGKFGRKAVDDLHKYATAISLDLRGKDLQYQDAYVRKDFMEESAFKSFHKKKIINWYNLHLQRNTKIAQVKSWKIYYVPMNRSSNFLGVVADTTTDDLKTKL